MKRSYAADGRDVVETEHRGKVSAAQQELMNSRIAKLRRVQVFVQLNDQVFRYIERKRACYLHDGLPSGLRVRAEGLAMHVSNPSVAQPVEVPQRELCRSIVVQNYIGHSRLRGVSGDGDPWSLERFLPLSTSTHDPIPSPPLQPPHI